MTSDSTRDATLEPDEPLRPPRWEFEAVEIERIELREPVYVPRGIEAVEVAQAVEVRLSGTLDPGDMESFDSYLPAIRIGDTQSARMSAEEKGVRFTIYPEVDGEIESGPIEFRARLGEQFSSTGLEV